MRGDALVRCGGRAGETGQEQSRNRAPARPLHETERTRPRDLVPALRHHGHLLAESRPLGNLAAETGTLAREFIEHAIAANGGIMPKAVHADRGTSMTQCHLACFCRVCCLRFCKVDESNGGRRVVAGAVVAGFLIQ